MIRKQIKNIYKRSDSTCLAGRHLQRGITLVEIMITIGITVLMMGVGIPAFRTYQFQNELNNYSENVKDIILTTQNYALAPEYDKNPNFNSYILYFDDSSQSFRIFSGNCDESGLKQVLEEKNAVKSIAIDPNLVKIESNLSEGDRQKVICYGIGSQGKIIYPVDNLDINFTLTHKKISDDKNNVRSIKLNPITGQVSISKSVE